MDQFTFFLSAEHTADPTNICSVWHVGGYAGNQLGFQVVVQYVGDLGCPACRRRAILKVDVEAPRWQAG